jgi:hypothetical protein
MPKVARAGLIFGEAGIFYPEVAMGVQREERVSSVICII